MVSKLPPAGEAVRLSTNGQQLLVARLPGAAERDYLCTLVAESDRAWTDDDAQDLTDLLAPFAELIALQATIQEQQQQTAQAQEHARYVDTINRVGQSLAADLDLERIVQVVTDAGTELTGAQFGAFFYNVVSDRGEAYTLYTLSGVPREAFSQFPMPRNTAVFHPTFSGEGVVRLDDVTRDPRYGRSAPYHGMPEGHLPVRSYLAVPVVSRSGEVLGGLFFGHEEVGVFDADDERLLVSIAAQAAVAIDSARLYGQSVRAERRFRDLVNGVEAIFWEADLATQQFTFVSDRAYTLLGYPVAEWQKSPDFWPNLIHPADRNRVITEHRAEIAAGRDHELEYRGCTADGREVWLRHIVYLVRDEAGGPSQLRGVILDVTSRKATEREQLLRQAVARTLNDAPTLRAAIPEVLRTIGELGDWQWGAFRLHRAPTGLPAAALESQLVWAAPPVDHRDGGDTQPASAIDPAGLAERVLATGEPYWSSNLQEDPNLAHGDPAGTLDLSSGYAFPIRHGGEIIATLVFLARQSRELAPEALENAAVLGNLIGQYIERKGTEEALRASEERLRFALEAGQLGTWDWDIQTDRLQWSATLQQLHGLTPGSFAGTLDACLGYIHLDDRDLVLGSVEHALQGGDQHEVEYRIVLPDGSQRWLMGRGHVVRDADSTPIRMTGICMDISERKRNEIALQFLTEASTVLASSLDYETTLSSVARLAVPNIADWCAVDLLTEAEGVQRLAVAHVDPEKVRLAYELQKRYPENPNASHGLHQVLRSGVPDMLSEIPQELLEASARDAEHLEIIRSLGLTSYIVMPLIARGRILGAISMVAAESKRRYGAEDLALVEELARRAATAIDNARLFRETQQAEVRLRHRLDFIRAVTCSLGEGLYAMDRYGRATYVNPAAERLLGWTESELLGQQIHEKIHYQKPDGTPFPESNCPLTRVRELGETYSSEDDSFVRRDGTHFPVSYFSTPVITDGQITGAVLTFRDITNRRLVEAAQARRAREAALVADVGVALNQTGSLRQILTGCTDALVTHIGAAFARIWTLDEAGATLELQASSGLYTHLNGGHARVPMGAFKIGRIAQNRKPHLTNDVVHDPEVGDPEWAAREGMVAFAGYPLMVEGRIIGVMALFARQSLANDTLTALGAIADIVAQGVERKRVEEELRRLNASLERRVRDRTAALLDANQELESFSYSVSHDLRAPLRHIAGFADLLRKRSAASLDSAGQRYLQTIQDSARHAGVLVDDLLAFSRMGRAELRKQLVDMHQLAMQVKAENDVEAADRKITWQIEQLPAVEGDAAMLRQVWRNLLSNAVKYTRDCAEAVIEVRGGVYGDKVVYSVRDNGVGFDPRYVDKLFGVFQRLHTSEEFEGTGIGLANVRRIIQRHGGRVWAEGILGQGAIFYFELPRQSREANLDGIQ